MLRRLSAVFALCFTCFSCAQQPVDKGKPLDNEHSFHPGQYYTIHHNVALVVLDGVAVDRQGHVVKDLKGTDFHITENDLPQNVRNFEEAAKFTPAPDVTINSSADLARLAPRAPVNIILLDEFTTRFEDMAYARYSLKKWLQAQPAKLDTPTMLVAVSLQKFDMLRDYTQDKDEVLKALDKHFAMYPWHLNQIEWSDEMYANMHIALRRVAEATVMHRGPKTMIWIGRGLPSNRRGNHSTDIVEKPDSTTAHTMNELRDARVTLYTIDPAGVLSNPELAYPSGGFGFAAFAGDARFQAMAAATGGRNFYNRNDVDTEIATSIRSGSSVITLTYIPPDPDIESKKLRKISVTVDRPGVRFLTRTAYYPYAKPPRMDGDDAMGRRMASSMAAAATTNLKYEGIKFSAALSATDVNAVRVHVDGPGVSYYASKHSSDERYTKLILMSTTFDKKDRPLRQQSMAYRVTEPKHTPSANRAMDLDFKLDPDPKAVRVRFVLRVDVTGTMGTVDLPLTAGASAHSSGEPVVAQPTGEKPAI